MKKVSLKKAIEIVFPQATDIKLNKGYYYCSGFFNVGEQVYYISSADVRTSNINALGVSGIMYRTAKDRTDYTGGVNTWDFNYKLQEKGYMLSSVPYKTC